MRSPSTSGRLCAVLVEQITEPLALHGEGPCWLESSGELAWVDMLAGRVLATSAATGETRVIDVPSAVAAIVRPRAAGGLVVATETGVVLLDEHDAALAPVRDPGRARHPHERRRLRPAGPVLVREHGVRPQPRSGSLYRVEADGTFTEQLTGVTISNGLGWSPDGETAFYVDSMAYGIDAFAFDGASGTLSGRRRFADVGGSPVLPDGLAVDAEGGVWVALWDGGAVHRYAPDGTLDAVVPLPCRRVTACAFGGAGLDELFITTSRLELPDGVDPDAGALFRCVPGVRGQAVLAFAG